MEMMRHQPARIADRDELASMFINRSLIDMPEVYCWSGSVSSPGAKGLAWVQYMKTGGRGRGVRTDRNIVRCVKR